MNKVKFTEESTLLEVLEAGGEVILKQNGVPCITCPLAFQEISYLKIGQVSRIYGLDAKKILNDVKELNDIKQS